MSDPIIQQKIEVIRNETNEGANTRGRVADVLTDLNNSSGGGSGTVQEIIAGDFIRVDNTDPTRPKITALVGEEYADKILTLGEVIASNNEVELLVHSSGSNSVRLGGVIYSKTAPSTFYYTQVLTPDYLKSLLVYALPDTTVFYLAEGVEGLEAIDPELPAGALLVRRIIVSAEGQEIEPPDVTGLREKFVDSWLDVQFNNNSNRFITLNKGSFHNFRIFGTSTAPRLGAMLLPDGVELYNGEPMMVTNNTAYPLSINNTSMVSPLEGRFVRFNISAAFDLAVGLSQLFAYNPINDKFEVVKFGSGGGGDFIPMSGTLETNPVSGPIWMGADKALRSVANASGNAFYIDSNEVAVLHSANDDYTSITPNNGLVSTNGDDEITVNSIVGVTANKYFGATALDNHFIQKKYVNDNYLNKVSATSQTITSPLTLSGQLTYNAPLTTDVASVLVKDSSNQIKSATSVNIIDIWESSSFPTATQLSINFPNAAMVMTPNTTIKRVYFRNGAFWTYVDTTLTPTE